MSFRAGKFSCFFFSFSWPWRISSFSQDLCWLRLREFCLLMEAGFESCFVTRLTLLLSNQVNFVVVFIRLCQGIKMLHCYTDRLTRPRLVCASYESSQGQWITNLINLTFKTALTCSFEHWSSCCEPSYFSRRGGGVCRRTNRLFCVLEVYGYPRILFARCDIVVN